MNTPGPYGNGHGERGSVLVEFALVLPIFLLLVFGMVTFSVALYDKTVFTMASREGARSGSRFVMDRSDSLAVETASAVALDACRDNLISFGPAMTPSVTASVTGDILTVTAGGTMGGLYLFPELEISSETSMRLE